MSTQREAVAPGAPNGTSWAAVQVQRNGRTLTQICPVPDAGDAEDGGPAAGAGEVADGGLIIRLVEDVFAGGIAPSGVFARLLLEFPGAAAGLGFRYGSKESRRVAESARACAGRIYGRGTCAGAALAREARVVALLHRRLAKRLVGRGVPAPAPGDGTPRGLVNGSADPVFRWLFPMAGQRPRFSPGQALRRMYYLAYKVDRPEIWEAHKSDLASFFDVTKTLITQEMNAMFAGIEIQSAGEFGRSARATLARVQTGNHSAARGR